MVNQPGSLAKVLPQDLAPVAAQISYLAQVLVAMKSERLASYQEIIQADVIAGECAMICMHCKYFEDPNAMRRQLEAVAVAFGLTLSEVTEWCSSACDSVRSGAFRMPPCCESWISADAVKIAAGALVAE